MKATEVIQEYKNGRRDFQGESLRGCNFKDQDLSGADFSGCDICGANFSGANLTEVKFERAKAGLRKRWMIFLLLVALVLIVISSFFSALVGSFAAYIFDPSSPENPITVWVSLIFLLFFCILIWRKNILAGAFAGAVAFVVAVAFAGVGVEAVVIKAVWTVATGAVVAVIAVVVAVGAVGVGTVGAVGAAVGAAGAAVGAAGAAAPVEVALEVAVAVAVALFFTWIGWLTLKQEHRDPWLRTIVIACTGFGGTSFFKPI
jgi:hypothetical protein